MAHMWHNTRVEESHNTRPSQGKVTDQKVLQRACQQSYHRSSVPCEQQSPVTDGKMNQQASASQITYVQSQDESTAGQLNAAKPALGMAMTCRARRLLSCA